MNKWEKGPVKLANGEGAFIDAINEGQEHYRYTGRIKLHDQWVATGWDESGRRMFAINNSPNNLAPPPKKTVRAQEMWIAVLYNGESLCYYSQQAAKNATYGNAVFAIKKIESFEVTEGEGL